MKNKVLLILWFILLIIIFGLLSVLGFMHKKDVESYKKYEDKLIEATKIYAHDNNSYPNKGSKIEIKVEDLIKGKYIKKKDIVKGCKGSIIIKYDNFIDYIPNIKCKYYKSK